MTFKYLTEKEVSELFAMRKAMDSYVDKIVENPVEINENMAAIRPWKPGAFSIGDVRMYEETPYKCVQAHDSTATPDWTPSATPALWMQYHGTTVETARPWIAPIGAHDMYQVGEYMIWTDDTVYKCIVATNFSPTDYAQAWEKVTE
jgi:hypothetical protein